MPSPNSQQSAEIAYISGVNSNGTMAQASFDTWATNTPGHSDVAKWGASAAGTTGGSIFYYLDPAAGWSGREQGGIKAALALWQAETNITFVQTSSAATAQLTFKRGSDGGAYADISYDIPNGGGLTGGIILDQIDSATISIDTDIDGFGPLGDTTFSSFGNYPWLTLFHEIGHAIGLGHSGPYDESAGQGDYDAAQLGIYDSRQWSVMSYVDVFDTKALYYAQYGQSGVSGSDWGLDNQGYPFEPVTPMVLDIAAAQRLYGTPTSGPLTVGQTFGFNCTIAGGTRAFFDFTQNRTPIITIWDSGAGNALDLSGYNTAATVNLNQGMFSSCAGLSNNIGIAFGTKIDIYIGTSGNDAVIGNDDSDTINGGLGNDTLTGGAGNDFLSGGTGTNVINGGGGSDTLVLGAASIVFSFSRGAGRTIMVNGPAETDTLTSLEYAQFSDKTISLAALFPAARNDFNGDGMSDILWQNSDGTAAVWLLNGATITGGTSVGNPGSAAWKAIGAGDFNGDGDADILWQNSDGTAAIWTMSGATPTGGGIAGNPGAGWTVLGAADFNGDGDSDILWRATDGTIAVWLMNGSTLTGGAVVGNPGSGWSFRGTGDFNGDGKTDILFQNSNGGVAVWLMNGATLTGGGVAGNPGSSWTARAVGDFDGDGKSDILWQNSGGQAAIWLMNGAMATGGGLAGANPGTSWTVVQAEDVNGDGKADILWQAADGSPAVWLMNGNTVSGGGIVGSNPGASWHVVTG